MLLDLLGIVVDALGLLSSGSGSLSSTSDRKSLNYDENLEKRNQKRSKYFTEKVSAVALVLAAFGFLWF